MKQTDKTVNGMPIAYEIQEGEYTIYLGGRAWIRQYGQYAKPIDPSKTLEENCLLQIEELTAIPEVEADDGQV